MHLQGKDMLNLALKCSSGAPMCSASEGTNPGFGFECFETFRLFQGKQKKLKSQVACFESFFAKHFGEIGEREGERREEKPYSIGLHGMYALERLNFRSIYLRYESET